ncbi:MAG: hypothetical protein ACI92C_002618 [Neolewinella sp.]|jgi:uncharacterized protein YpmS
MKYIFFLLLAFTGFTLTAQNTITSTSTSVSETATDNTYSFMLTVDRKQVDDLLDAYLKIADRTGVKKLSGESWYTTDEGATVKINTTKRTLSISSGDDRPESISVARGLADRVREELDLALAPAPPH